MVKAACLFAHVAVIRGHKFAKLSLQVAYLRFQTLSLVSFLAQVCLARVKFAFIQRRLRLGPFKRLLVECLGLARGTNFILHGSKLGLKVMNGTSLLINLVLAQQ